MWKFKQKIAQHWRISIFFHCLPSFGHVNVFFRPCCEVGRAPLSPEEAAAVRKQKAGHFRLTDIGCFPTPSRGSRTRKFRDPILKILGTLLFCGGVCCNYLKLFPLVCLFYLDPSQERWVELWPPQGGREQVRRARRHGAWWCHRLKLGWGDHHFWEVTIKFGKMKVHIFQMCFTILLSSISAFGGLGGNL